MVKVSYLVACVCNGNIKQNNVVAGSQSSKVRYLSRRALGALSGWTVNSQGLVYFKTSQKLKVLRFTNFSLLFFFFLNK